VNEAARIQHLAGAREAVVAASLADAVPRERGVEAVEHFEATVKGIAAPLRVARLRVGSRGVLQGEEERRTIAG
jgi:class 3 adenylate cyclase